MAKISGNVTTLRNSDPSTPVATTPIYWGRRHYRHPGVNLGTGNRCGHDPLKPDFHRYTPPDTRNLPKMQQKLLTGAWNYYDNPWLLPTLANLSGRENLDGQPRQNRSDGRDPEARVLAAILHRTDYTSLRVGTPMDNGQFKPRSCGELAHIAGLLEEGCGPDSPIPNPRFWRAWRRLRDAGLFVTHLQYEVLADGRKRARPAIKKLNLDFLVALSGGSYMAFNRFTRERSRALKAKRSAWTEANPGYSDGKLARNKMQFAVGHFSRTPRGDAQTRLTRRSVEQNDSQQRTQQILKYFNELRLDHPDKDEAWLLKQARAKFPPKEEPLN